MSETHEHRLIVHISTRERDLIADFQFGQRIGSRAEAVRRILSLGFAAAGLASDPEPVDQAQASEPLEAPTIPTPEEAGKPVMGELILPWLRKQGRREYEQQEVLEGVFGKEGALAAHRDKVVQKCFAAIGWKMSTTRLGGVTRRVFKAPEA